MLFSSTVFIFVFLALVIALYYSLQPFGRNYYLLAASIFFYAWGEPVFVLVMLASIALNYFLGLLIDRQHSGGKNAKVFLVLAVIVNIGLLFVFKYLNFTVSVINGLFGHILSQTKILLPIGISFFTFQGLSYVIDVYRGTAPVQKNPFYVALYISFFPQLIAGPIVRYNTVAEQLTGRVHSLDKFAEGVRRFIIGLSKKVLIANMLAVVADQAFTAARSGGIGASFAWLGAAAYAFQILFDFSGYSEMAVGLGKMFGFDFPENFDYPYISASITEFWRRWHISLSTWFRDYVYIPMGGSRVKSKTGQLFNLFTVWLLTGIWHGANWTFIVWGLFYFVLLSFEKLTALPEKCRSFVSRNICRIFTLLAVLFGWVIFRADSIGEAVGYISYMFGGAAGAVDYTAFYLREYWPAFVFAILLSTRLFVWGKQKLMSLKSAKIWVTTSYFIYAGLFLLSVGMLIMDSYNPFIYFNF